MTNRRAGADGGMRLTLAQLVGSQSVLSLRALWLPVATTVTVWAGACVDERRVTGDEGPRPTAWPGIVSDPVTSGASAASGSARSLATYSASGVAYVSLAPGTIPNGELAVISHRGTGSAVVAAMVAGGLDPVPVVAASGDTLDIDVRVTGSDSTLHFSQVVAAARRPIVVRTDPPHRKRDVALNASIVIVFSEPIDPATLTETSVQLKRDGPIAGRLEFRDPANLTVAFVPEAPLVAATTYQLVVTQGIRDLDGEPLEAPVSVDFTTQPIGGAGSKLAVTVQPANTVAGWSIRPALQVTVQDASGNTATTFTGNVSIALGTNPAGGSLTGTNTAAAVAGVATFGDLQIGAAGTGYTLTATATGLSGVTSTAFDVITLSPGRIAFTRTTIGNATGSGIFFINPDGSLTRLTSSLVDEMPAWSPDGTKLAYSCGGICVVNADGSGLSVLTQADDRSPGWSPDSRKIAFLRNVDSLQGGGPFGGGNDIYTMNPDGSGVAWLTADGGSGGLSWSPDGAKLAFSSWRDGSLKIYVVNADGSGVTPLSTDPGFANVMPAWSPDGTKIAFVRGVQDPDYGYYITDWAVHVMNADGSGVTRLTTTALYGQPAWLAWPTWSPDGRQIAFNSDNPATQGGFAAIHVMNADGSGLTQLTFIGDYVSDDQPAWSPEGATAGSRSPSR